MEKSDLEIQFHEAVASTLRAMAGGTEHEVVFVGDNTFIGNDKVRLPKINDIKSDSSRFVIGVDLCPQPVALSSVNPASTA